MNKSKYYSVHAVHVSYRSPRTFRKRRDPLRSPAPHCTHCPHPLTPFDMVMDEGILRMLGALAADNADEELCSQIGKLMDQNSEVQDEFMQSQSTEEGLLFPIMTLRYSFTLKTARLSTLLMVRMWLIEWIKVRM